MSKIRLQGNASGTGTLTIASPNTNSDTTVNLPSTLGNAGTSAMVTTDASGNLGLGVTPSAWGSGTSAIDIGSGSALWNPGSGTQTQLLNNSFNNGTNFIYKNSSSAARYRMTGAQHEWYTAPSGTAGNAISFTQAMTLDASGNLLVGASTSDLTARVMCIGSSGFAVQNAGSAGTYLQIVPGAANGTVGIVADARTGAYPPLTFTTGGTERVRIDSSGNVGIATTSPAGWTAKFAVAGAVLSGGQNYSASFSDAVNSTLRIAHQSGLSNLITDTALAFYTANGERARIDTSGNLLVGTTSTPSSTNPGVRIAQPGSNTWISYNSGTASFTQFIFGNANGQVGSISTSGSNTSYATSSDYRLKHDIAPMTGALAKIAALKPVTYKWNADNSDGEGFIAHELAEVVPQCVTGEKDAVDADGNPQYQGIDTSFLVATLTAAIQELKAEFDAYKAAHP